MILKISCCMHPNNGLYQNERSIDVVKLLLKANASEMKDIDLGTDIKDLFILDTKNGNNNASCLKEFTDFCKEMNSLD